MKKNHLTVLKIRIIAVISCVLIVILGILSIPYMRELMNPDNQEAIHSWVQSAGVKGWFFMLIIQIVQVVIAFIPGEPVEIMAGVLYGGLGGLVLCLLGSVIASCGIFWFTGKIGRPFVEQLVGKGKLKKFAFLHDSKKMDTVIFIIFLIPGTPKDLLTYVAGSTEIKLSKFLIISTFARIPAVVTSTFMGSTFIQGNWKATIFIFLLNAIIGILGIKYQNNIIEFGRKIGIRK